MLNLKDKKECCGCSACKNICPRNAISMCEDEQKFKYPKINYDFCINCGLCEKVCPILNKQVIQVKNFPKAYAGYSQNEEIRMKSSSGGIFTEIAKIILNNKGIVFGVTLDENFNAYHIAIESEDDLSKVRGSKYIQSDIKNTYKEAKKFLEDGRVVLFTGTPCQIEGLYSFLRKPYENLFTQDLICHGVPSKVALDKYIEGKVPKSISFRDKSQNGWSKYEVSLEYEDNVVKINHDEDLFMQMFLSDTILRPSCYDCKFKKVNRISDITLADFWGINEVLPELNDEKGTSLIIVHSKKGEEMLNKIQSNIVLRTVDFETAIKNNPSMVLSPKVEKYNPSFYEDSTKLDMENLAKKYINKQ